MRRPAGPVYKGLIGALGPTDQVIPARPHSPTCSRNDSVTLCVLLRHHDTRIRCRAHLLIEVSNIRETPTAAQDFRSAHRLAKPVHAWLGTAGSGMAGDLQKQSYMAAGRVYCVKCNKLPSCNPSWLT